MRARSLDLRQRVVAAVHAGHGTSEVAVLFGIDRSTLNRYLHLEATGALAPKPHLGRVPHIPPAQHADLVRELHPHPDDTLADHYRRWEAVHGVRVSLTTMSRTIRRVGWTRNKGHWQPWSATRLPVEDLVFVDETGTNAAMTARSGRGPRGQRTNGRAPRNHGPNTTLLAGLTHAGIGPAILVEGATTTKIFTAYPEYLLIPWLRPGQIVVQDNLSAHTGAQVQTVIAAAGCQVRYLPAYSPDFSPIE